MNQAQLIIEIDFWQEKLPPIRLQQSESAGRVLHFQIYDYAKVFDFTGYQVKAEGVRDDGQPFDIDCTAVNATDGLFDMVVPDYLVAKAGEVAIQVKFYKDETKVIRSRVMGFEVLKSINPDELIVETNLFRDMRKKLADVEQITREVATQESERVEAEKLRVQAETSRVEAENSRVQAEESRVNSEKARVNLSTELQENEETRKTNETARIENENARGTAESNRVSAENTRVENETKREQQEMARQNKLEEFVNAEKERQDNETKRQTFESNRVEAENARVLAEKNRVTAETQRAQVLETVKANEEIRISNEKARLAQEKTRQEADTQRGQRADSDHTRAEEDHNKYLSDQKEYGTFKETINKLEGGELLADVTAMETKLAGIEEGANNYALPTASSTTLGGVKIGDGIDLAEDGTISAQKVDLTPYAKTADVNAVPDGGTVGQVLKKTSTGYAWGEDKDTKPDLSPYAKTVDIEAALDEKVGKVIGKGLSTNDYSNADKAKVDGIPSDPKYTDTTYSNATKSTAGLMSGADKSKLDGIETGATNTTVLDSLTSTSATSALSANQGRALNERVTQTAEKFGEVARLKVLTQAEFEALSTKDPGTLYLVKEG